MARRIDTKMRTCTACRLITLTNSLTTTSLRLSLIAAALGRDSSGNVVYVNGAADAEKTAQQIRHARRQSRHLSG